LALLCRVPSWSSAFPGKNDHREGEALPSRWAGISTTTLFCHAGKRAFERIIPVFGRVNRANSHRPAARGGVTRGFALAFRVFAFAFSVFAFAFRAFA